MADLAFAERVDRGTPTISAMRYAGEPTNTWR
jgi:hypothetical protein